MCLDHQLNITKDTQFAGKLLQILNDGAGSLMISMGHRTGLFDVLKDLPPLTSSEISLAAGLNERYVKEWLAALTAMNFIEYDPAAAAYSLPAEYSGFLTRAAGADNIAVFTQYISLLGSVEDEIVHCFKYGGGVDYSHFKRFHEVMAEDSGQSVVSSLFEVILPEVPGIINKLKKGINVADIGCGKGKAITMMAKAFPESRFIGLDLSPEAISSARNDANTLGLTNIRFRVQDLTGYHLSAPEERYDFITAFDAIHDQVRPDNVLKGIYKALKNDGLFLMQDISASSELQNNLDHPLRGLLYTISTMHCMTVSLSQGGMGLGTMWGREKAMQMLREAGFSGIEIKTFDHDIQNDYYIIKK